MQWKQRPFCSVIYTIKVRFFHLVWYLSAAEYMVRPLQSYSHRLHLRLSEMVFAQGSDGPYWLFKGSLHRPMRCTTDRRSRLVKQERITPPSETF
jgi:hypothetical protein